MSSSSGTSFGLSTPGGSDIGTLTGNQFLWGSPNPYPEHVQSSAWPRSLMGHSLVSNGNGQGFPYSSCHVPFVPSSHHHVGSAPLGMPFERHFGYFPDSPEASFMNHVAPGSVGSLGPNEGRLPMNIGARGPISSSVTLDNLSDNISPGVRMMPSQRLGNMFLGTTPFPSLIGDEGLVEYGRSCRVDNYGFDNSKQQFQLDLEKIVSREDTRTTLMIKNIPNKYTSKMLLAVIDEKHMGSYDFLYLPIDFKNKCNVGYAFINMVFPSHVISFYEVFNEKKWEKFNSEKVSSLAYARIQGLDALISHFQNSSLMNEDKRCRPIIFHSKGLEAADQMGKIETCSSTPQFEEIITEVSDIPKGSNTFIHLTCLDCIWNIGVKMSLLRLATILNAAPLLEEFKLRHRGNESGGFQDSFVTVFRIVSTVFWKHISVIQGNHWHHVLAAYWGNISTYFWNVLGVL